MSGFIFAERATKLSVTILHYVLRVSPSCVFDETRITKRCMAPRGRILRSLPFLHPRQPRNSQAGKRQAI